MPNLEGKPILVFWSTFQTDFEKSIGQDSSIKKKKKEKLVILRVTFRNIVIHYFPMFNNTINPWRGGACFVLATR